jgi:hypothetical protein
MKASTLAFRTALFCLLGYGLFYFSYKAFITGGDTGDFRFYEAMIQHPLDFHATESPFVYRQLTAISANLIGRSHFFYRSSSPSPLSLSAQRLMFDLMLTNFLGVLLTASVVAAFMDRWLEFRSEIVPLFAGLLCFFSFYLQDTTISPGADGLSWTLLAVCFYAFKGRQRILFAVVCSLSIIQREILPILFCVFAAVELVRHRGQKIDRFQWFVLGWSGLCLAGYFSIRRLVRAPGFEEQTDVRHALHVFQTLPLDRHYFMQVFVSQNLLAVVVILWAILYMRHRQTSREMVPILASFTALLSVTVVTNIGYTAGRILAILTPVICIEIVQIMVRLECNTAPTQKVELSKVEA